MHSIPCISTVRGALCFTIRHIKRKLFGQKNTRQSIARVGERARPRTATHTHSPHTREGKPRGSIAKTECRTPYTSVCSVVPLAFSSMSGLKRLSVKRLSCCGGCQSNDVAEPTILTEDEIKALRVEKVRRWSESFIAADPRHQILEYFRPGDHRGPLGLLKALGEKPAGDHPTSYSSPYGGQRAWMHSA